MKTILMLGDPQLTGTWEETINEVGNGAFKVHRVFNIQEALEYINKSHDFDSDLQLVVDAVLPTGEPKDLPKELQGVDVFKLGAAFIRYARDKGLITSTSPAYLMNYSEMPHTAEELKGITKNVPMEECFSTILGIVNPPLHRPDTRTVQKEA